jgi:hypothetical protein
MLKPLAPEVLALIPEGIENLTLSCTVCRGPLPSSRRTVGDHAGACHKVRTLFRRYQIKLKHCIACLHPSTPAEREEFKAWRRARGQLRATGGRPAKSRVPSPERKELAAPDSGLGTAEASNSATFPQTGA